MSPPQTRKRSRPNQVDNHDFLLEQNPVTVTEKLNLQEKKFEALVVEFDQLKIEQKLCKDQVSVCQQEISEWKKTSDEHRAEICKWKKMCEDLRSTVESKLVAIRSKESTSSPIDETLQKRAIYNKLPCKSVDEYEQLKLDLANTILFVFMEQRLGSIGGADVRSCIVAILNRLMTPELQGRLSLTGKRTTKPGLTDTIILELVHCAVRVTHPNYKDKDGEAIIGKLFSNK